MNVADAFVCLPGGIGTLDEIFNVLAGARMGLHQKKIALLDIDGFFKSLVCFLGEMVEKGFLKKRYFDELIVEQDVLRLLERIR
ncbi:Cytokinin riboside 5'-monophosphate phosphoribohydrolase (fragment) [Denitratisoma oestradiolicum]|uniref:AMP nucleosidase n=2 Tax=Denitratisoma oestradiolicum TaxID=311182 RepID=A0A6S6Y735_9PROT